MSPYSRAQEQYASLGVDTEAALRTLESTAISLNCWQGDDVGGFDKDAAVIGGGLAVTGNHPGKARTPDELRADVEKALSVIPGKHRLNLHACYAERGSHKTDRNSYTVEYFQNWIDWAKSQGIGLDFNPTYFAHPLANSGRTLSNADSGVRKFWIEHGIASRKIGAEMGRALGSPCITNFWIPDGSKDLPADRLAPRQRLMESLDAIFVEAIDPALNRDAVECKLFGIGTESYVVGSHEFYLGYAIRNQKVVCLDTGHFHPTESVADKISSVLLFAPELLLHLSRGVRWDSDHVVLFDDPTRAIMEELVRGNFLGRTHIGLDFFDASINRIAGWAIGARNALKALLLALLEPTARLREAEIAGDFTTRLVLLEELKTLPLGAVWKEYCDRKSVPGCESWLDEVKSYEREVLAKR